VTFDTDMKLESLLKDKEMRHKMMVAHLSWSIAHQIKTLREGRGWSQGELAKRAKVSRMTVWRYERPTNKELSIKTLVRFARAFDCALSIMFEEYGKFVEPLRRMLIITGEGVFWKLMKGKEK